MRATRVTQRRLVICGTMLAGVVILLSSLSVRRTEAVLTGPDLSVLTPQLGPAGAMVLREVERPRLQVTEYRLFVYPSVWSVRWNFCENRPAHSVGPFGWVWSWRLARVGNSVAVLRVIAGPVATLLGLLCALAVLSTRGARQCVGLELSRATAPRSVTQAASVALLASWSMVIPLFLLLLAFPEWYEVRGRVAGEWAVNLLGWAGPTLVVARCALADRSHRVIAS